MEKRRVPNWGAKWKEVVAVFCAAALPTATDWFEAGSFPSSLRGWITETTCGAAILMLGIYALRRVWASNAALSRKVSDLRKLSMTDALTELGNARAFREAMEALNFARDSLWILAADLDRLKLVNDVRGHAAGDLLLMRASGTLRRCIAANCGDMAFRIGGDEFALLIHGSEAVAVATAKKILLAMADDPDRATFSIGLSRPGFGESPFEAAERADEALYEAKRAGGDCLRMAGTHVRRTARACVTGMRSAAR